jgi:uncharacterized protein YbaP (TraB family)
MEDMKRIVALAERSSLAWLGLLAGLNLLFFMSFLIMALLAASKAQAQVPACTGIDLATEMQENDPAAFAKIAAEAAKVPNGKGLLWKLEKTGQKPSFLFGTMHMTDPRVTALPAAARNAFDGADTLVIETTGVLDKKAMMASLASDPELTMFTGKTTLSSLLSPKDAALVDKALEARGIPPASVARMKPWMLAAMLAVPECELARKSRGEPVLDISLAQQARAAGKAVEGVETVADQLRAMASLPLSFHVKGLVQTLQLGDRVNDLNETMIALYRQGEIGMIWPLLRAAVPEEPGDGDGYAAFEETMVTSRNKVMAEHALPILGQGNVFMAVGALHLPGAEGLVEDFRKAGYTVTVAD